jgi:hypothetical protein
MLYKKVKIVKIFQKMQIGSVLKFAHGLILPSSVSQHEILAKRALLPKWDSI